MKKVTIEITGEGITITADNGQEVQVGKWENGNNERGISAVPVLLGKCFSQTDDNEEDDDDDYMSEYQLFNFLMASEDHTSPDEFEDALDVSRFMDVMAGLSD